MNRKITGMKMDPKADASSFATLEGLRDEYASCIALSNIGFYRVRVLKDLYREKDISN